MTNRRSFDRYAWDRRNNRLKSLAQLGVSDRWLGMAVLTGRTGLRTAAVPAVERMEEALGSDLDL